MDLFCHANHFFFLVVFFLLAPFLALLGFVFGFALGLVLAFGLAVPFALVAFFVFSAIGFFGFGFNDSISVVLSLSARISLLIDDFFPVGRKVIPIARSK